MVGKPDVEAGEGYDSYEPDNERQSLLPTASNTQDEPTIPQAKTKPTYSHPRCQFSPTHLLLAFLAGAFVCVLTQLAICGPSCFTPGKTSAKSHSVVDNVNHDLAPPYVGSTERHHFPPASPTNAYPSLFPTKVGYPGGTKTGAEPGMMATAPSYPMHTGTPAHLIAPATLEDKNGKGKKEFDLFKKWGNLSPWYSVDRTEFGLDSGPEAPETCRITGLHLLHRHGARYPTAWASYGGPANFSGRLHAVAEKWNASGDLDFMNEWTFKLGEESLTAFGRYQLFDLGVSMRLKYGFLLKNFTATNTIPVFRTESQDRMLASAQNFAIGFFGYPFKGKYQQSISIEAKGFNNTLAPYDTCTNTQDKNKADRGMYYVARWADIYLKNAVARLQPQMSGFKFTSEDVYVMQQLCAYETVSLGYSKFCELFTEEEWEGFDYAIDLILWYGSAFGSPVARVQGIGWVEEFVARLTHTPIPIHNSSTNSTLDDNPITFPLKQSLYVDATHEVVILNIITALNLTNFAASGPLPYDHIPPNRSFKVSELVPFATNVQFQLLECTSVPDPQIRIIINDGVTPLTGIKGCPEQRDGMCPVETFVAAQKEIIAATDWNYDCYGDWTVPEGPAWNTTTGSPPK